ncbi:uncharacterized protein FOMMEDRAFT_144296 [Fomitiporia mediterranea MF3/22]|uniref:uncharacterized protein n=1 Tax=Fomitiporia mediterranea (strain MF3/22) TaxID=694068 RepID=UPI0004407E57|nr:uncharacterized protein FOMMEDRAFT_144296 [Fomitiporia mediterranea MF3/22]EJD08355.1 hypothetical protein FOMMEDRAFT_144296 [Fomitiporia mediterranea MF3/22]
MERLTDEELNCDNAQVPSSGRGGLGNIRAKNKAKNASSLTISPSSKSRTSSSTSGSGPTSPSPFRIRSNSTRSVMSSAASVISNSNSLSASLSSGSPDEDRVEVQGRTSLFSFRSRSSEINIAGPSAASSSTSGPSDLHHSGNSYEPSSPTFGTFATPLSSPSSSGRTTSAGSTSASADYAIHLQTDARQRALEKRLVRERAKEARLMAGNGPAVPNGLNGPADSGAEGAIVRDAIEDSVLRVRTGRGGAAVFKKVGSGINPALYPRAADITREYEERSAAQERNLLAESRARAAKQGSTGRGGAGNIAGPSSGVKGEAKKGKKDKKGKGKARADIGDGGGDEGPQGENVTTQDIGDVDDEATLAEKPKDRKKKHGLQKLWKRVVRANTESNAGTLHPEELDDRTPRPSFGDGVLEIGRLASPSASLSSTLQSPPSVASTSSSRTQGPLKLRKHENANGKERQEGAALLAFVNAAIPGTRNNVLGVPGTPGFPLPSECEETVSSAVYKYGPDYRSSGTSSLTTHANGSINSNATASREGFTMKPIAEAREDEDWVDDETLQEPSEVSDEEEEDEDSDIDPHLLSALKKAQSQSYKYKTTRPDSLDAVIRVALDKLDLEEHDTAGAFGFDPNFDSGVRGRTPAHGQDHFLSSRAPPSSFKQPVQAHRSPQDSPPTAFSQPPRYTRASVPAVRTRVNGAIGTGNAVKSRSSVPDAGPPPTRPVPSLPE